MSLSRSFSLYLSLSLSVSVFLDASSHLYKRVCPSVGPSVRWSFGNAFVSAGRDELANDFFRVYELVSKLSLKNPVKPNRLIKPGFY